VGFRSVLDGAIPRFEQASGHHVAVTYGTLGQIVQRAQSGEAADVVVIPRQGLEDMARQGLLPNGGITPIARSAVGMAMRHGRDKPDISTAEGFRRAMLEAKSVITVNPESGGVSGVHFRTLFERMAIADQMKPKLRYQRMAGNAELAREASEGTFDVALNQLQDLVDIPGFEIVGPLPEEMQLRTVFAAAATGKGDAAAARALVDFLSGSEVSAIILAKGLQPAGR
jgi:molybdate transport system substrate-binding protein